LNSLRYKVLIVFGAFFLLLTSLLIKASQDTHSAEEYWAREYGVGIVAYEDMPNYSCVDTIYAKPNLNSEIVAVLNNRELCFNAPKDTCVFSFGQMIEYSYEIPGFAILSFNVDSSWAKVTLDPWDKLTSKTGWIHVKKLKTAPILWSDIIPRKNPLFFINPDSIRLFTKPDYNYEVEIILEVYDNSDRLDYEMHPLVVEGRWMKVEVLTPSQYCKSKPPESKVDTLWIEYLSKSLRPKVFYYTRVC